MINCHLNPSHRWAVAPVLACCLWVGGGTSVSAQTATTGQDVDLVVDGRVERVFRDDDQYLVEILVQAADAPTLDASGAIRYPAPGQCIYVHLDASQSVLGRVVRGSRAPEVPNPKSTIRASLRAGDAGRWVASGQDWFDDSPGPRDGRWPLDRSPAAAADLGIKAERVFVGGESGLKVSEVQPGSPAANAGIEPGDVIMKAAGTELESQAQLEQAFGASRGNLEVMVRDVRSKRDVAVQIESGGRPAGTNPPAASLGVVTETAFFGGETSLKVTRVDPNSPAQRAGIRPGLLITKANGQAVGKPDQLNDIVQRSRGRLELEIVDPEERRASTIQVRL